MSQSLKREENTETSNNFNKNSKSDSKSESSYFNLQVVINDILCGIWDSFKIFNIWGVISKNSKILNNLTNCFILNGLLFIGSMILYFYLIEPTIEFIADKFFILGFFLTIGKYFYYIFWLIPVFLLCNIITSFWIDEIYYESLSVIQNDNQIKIQGQDLVTAVANQIERLLIVVSFLIFIFIINFFTFLPGVSILKYITLSILNSLYVFEYILLQNYIKDYKSIIYFIEDKLFYFLGYGLLLTIMINVVNSVTINSSIFLMAFPLFLISSIQVSKLRFQHTTGIEKKNLIFLFLIDKFYAFGIEIFYSLFFFLKKRGKGKKKIKD